MSGDVSIIVAAYNYAHFLPQCLDSIAKQTKQPGEVLIMDDCSTDDTGQVAMDYLRDGHLTWRYLGQVKNKGVVANVNDGFSRATGKYLMCVSADDFLDETYVEKTADVLDKSPGTGVVYTNAIAFGNLAAERSQSSSWCKKAQPWAMSSEFGPQYLWKFFDYNVDQISLRGRLAKRNFIHGTSLFRRSAWEAGARYRENIVGAEDWDFWKQIILKQGWGAKLVKEPLLFYRQHSDGQRNATRKV